MDTQQQNHFSNFNPSSSEQWWNKIREVTQKAIKLGSIATLQTSQVYVEDGGVVWIIKVASSLNKKPTAQQTPAKFFNPFDEETMDRTLFVESLFGTHNLLLNKFNVSPFHLLITTKSFQPQADLLNQQDFKAIWFGVNTFNSLMFFNCGKNSGASQPHKHVQLIPLPLDPSQAETRTSVSGTNFPLEPILQKGSNKPPGEVFSMTLPFKQAALRLPQPSELGSILSNKTPLEDNAEWFQLLEKYYLSLYNHLELDKTSSEGEKTSYNFLMTRNWMWMVPRSNEKYNQTISINSVGFAGTALVKSEQDLETLKSVGPLEILKSVTFPC